MGFVFQGVEHALPATPNNCFNLTIARKQNATKEKNMKDCKRCFFSKPHKAWRIICLRTGRQATKPCKFFREKEDLK